ncbi:maleylpyruvate isomerase N-terminal domain-containing protein [Hymenobacter aerilatus]|uniref:Maleylpyruvate isomerase N-terminal domain-containing protein n=1 Tax=Hymenobacter aerilatus TaxID=2932251 RepID=A0A8T9T4U7_9BACT|nr:maleylpyruvate isomerase N-terminal domain-containing protein [Hymenobacter aerilatus]UOR06919.1 maleylpyruvate isomerase N-terminal domain-containing protein [Hymenobacter aerilatus]
MALLLVPDTLHLFPILDVHLLAVLQSLQPADWQRPTVAPQWDVQAVALHLLDGNLRTLSMLRDGYFGMAGPASPSYDDVVTYLNRLNVEWVTAGRRLSPSVIRWLLELSGQHYTAYLTSLDLDAPATFAVAWTGEETSSNRFHIARDYTEKWHHQQQIRLAVGQTDVLLQPELYQPFLLTCLQALPHHYRAVEAPPGTVIQVTITEPGAVTCYVHRTEKAWQLLAAYPGESTTTITLAGAAAWRLFTKSLPPAQAAAHAHVTGNMQLADPFWRLVTVMG